MDEQMTRHRMHPCDPAVIRRDVQEEVEYRKARERLDVTYRQLRAEADSLVPVEISGVTVLPSASGVVAAQGPLCDWANYDDEGRWYRCSRTRYHLGKHFMRLHPAWPTQGSGHAGG